MLGVQQISSTTRPSKKWGSLRSCFVLRMSSLIGFGGMKVLPVGTISLPVVVGSYLEQIIKEVNFLIVDCSSSYNAIKGRPTLNNWRAATSTHHFSIKFPTGSKRLVGSQRMLFGHTCYRWATSDNEYQREDDSCWANWSVGRSHFGPIQSREV